MIKRRSETCTCHISLPGVSPPDWGPSRTGRCIRRKTIVLRVIAKDSNEWRYDGILESKRARNKQRESKAACILAKTVHKGCNEGRSRAANEVCDRVVRGTEAMEPIAIY